MKVITFYNIKYVLNKEKKQGDRHGMEKGSCNSGESRMDIEDPDKDNENLENIVIRKIEWETYKGEIKPEHSSI